MNLLSKIYKIDKSNYQLALDIGTESAKAIVFLSDKKEEKVTIKGAGIRRHGNGDMQGGVVFNLDGVIKTCKEAIADAESAAKAKPTKVYVSIGGEYIKNLTETRDFRRADEKIRISLAELEEMVCTTQKKIHDSSGSALKWNDLRMIGADVVDFSIDGYRVINPVNFKGSNIRITISNSYVEKEHYDLVSSIVSKLGLSLLGISYGPYAVLKAIGAHDVMNFNAIFIDVGGSTTDVVVIKNRNIEDDRFFIFGGKAFTNSIAEDLDINFHDAEKIKLEYSENKIFGGVKDKIRNTIQRNSILWGEGIGISLDDLSRSNLLPSKILLYGGGSHLPEIKTGLEVLLRTNKYSFSDVPEIKYINPSDVVSLKDESGIADSMQYVTAISLANLSLDLANEEDLPNQIIKKCYLTDK